MKERICQNCGKIFRGHPALSRKDNKTLICPDCGQKEALEDYFDLFKPKKILGV